MKSMDVIYKQLSKMSSFQHEPDVSSYVHEYSTKQAEALFVSAINRQVSRQQLWRDAPQHVQTFATITFCPAVLFQMYVLVRVQSFASYTSRMSHG